MCLNKFESKLLKLYNCLKYLGAYFIYIDITHFVQQKPT